MSEEVWKEIPSFPGYEASTEGRIRSWRRQGVPHLLKLSLINGYLAFTAYVAGAKRNVKVHRAVLLAFVGQPLPGQECRHLNGVRSDLRRDNLCYGTHKENMADSILHGTNNGALGERHWGAKLCAAQVLEIRATYAAGGVTHKELGLRYGVSKTNIRDIIKRHIWTHI